MLINTNNKMCSYNTSSTYLEDDYTIDVFFVLCILRNIYGIKYTNILKYIYYIYIYSYNCSPAQPRSEEC